MAQRFLFYKASVNTDELVHVGNDTNAESAISAKPWFIGTPVPPRPKGPTISADLYEHVDNPPPSDDLVPFLKVFQFRTSIFTPLPRPYGPTVSPTLFVHDENSVNTESLVRYQPPWFLKPLPRPRGSEANAELIQHTENPYDASDCAWLIPSAKPFHVARKPWVRPRGSAVSADLIQHQPNVQCWHEETLQSGSWAEENRVEACS